MTPTKLLVGQMLVVFAIVIVGVWFVTEWCAAELGFPPQRGSPWFVLLGVPVCCPWQLFAWWFWYDASAPAVFNKAGAIAAPSGVAGRADRSAIPFCQGERAAMGRSRIPMAASRWRTTCP
jgi:type IV secretion system protein VirD4